MVVVACCCTRLLFFCIASREGLIEDSFVRSILFCQHRLLLIARSHPLAYSSTATITVHSSNNSNNMDSFSTGECAAPPMSLSTSTRYGDTLQSFSPFGIDPTLFFFLTTMISIVILATMMIEKHHIVYHFKLWIEYLTTTVPTLDVPMTPAESEDDGVKGEPVKTMELLDGTDKTKLNCYDPSTKQFIGRAPNMTSTDVEQILLKAKEAQDEWKRTTFAQRRMVLRTIQKYIVQHVEDICRVSARESGKPLLDGVLGEVLTTCEKIRTICECGELWLRPDYRSTGPMMMHKTAWVEYVPLGVIVAIAPWNYPFHNSVSIVSMKFLHPSLAGNFTEGHCTLRFFNTPRALS